MSGTKRGRHICGIALLIVVQMVLAVGIVEFLGQAYFDNPNYYWEQRFMFMSPDGLRNVGRFWTYVPNTKVKEIAMYQTPFGGFEKEYECDYPIDRLGFVDNENSSRREYDVLLLGDSFTQGQGGCPWASVLRRYLPDLSIYNAGLQGTGPGTWAPITRYLMQEGLRFHAVVVIFIADDFRRGLNNVAEDAFVCLHDISQCHGKFFYPLTSDLDLVRTSRERAEAQDVTGPTKRVLYFWKKYLWVSHFLAWHIRDLVQVPQSRRLINEDAEEGLAWLMANLPNLKFVEIRQKDELALGSINAPGIVIEKYLRDRKVDWAVCDIGYDGFLPNDGHPDRKGYDKLAQCIANVVRGSRAPRS